MAKKEKKPTARERFERLLENSCRELVRSDVCEGLTCSECRAFALVNGGAALLPARIGDAVFVLDDGVIREGSVEKIVIARSGVELGIELEGPVFEYFDEEYIGSVVFFRREDAERACRESAEGS